MYSETVPLLSKSHETIDLTYSASRGMSPIHGQYVKNSGASSSFSISIIIDDQLWGLVTCQNVEPKHIDLEDRVQAGIFTALASNAYSSFKSKNELNYRLELNGKMAYLKTEFLKHNNLFNSLIDNKAQIKKLPEADGLAIIADETIVTEGNVPGRDTILRIIKWAHAHTEDDMYLSRSFLKDHGAELDLTENAAGVAIYFIERSKNNLVIWFRKEFDEHIDWAGNPEKKIGTISQNGEERRIVSPRPDFLCTRNF